MNRYFLNFINDQPVFNDEQIFHIKKVMRLTVGDKLELVDINSQTLYICVIETINPSFSCKIVEKTTINNELNVKIRLLYVLPKGDKLDLVIQKATELGVDEIVLLTSSRSIVKIDESKLQAKLARYYKIALEASEQAKRNKIPTITGVFAFNYLENIKGSKLIAYENENNNYILNKLDQKDEVINILVGPEGGFSPLEVETVIKWGYTSVSLGKTILRSETAAITSVALIAAYYNK